MRPARRHGPRPIHRGERAAGRRRRRRSTNWPASRWPRIDGNLKVPGLKQPVEIIRDQQGIPHIFAKNDDDLFFAQGYVMAQDRLWQMEMWRRWREGRLAEVFGPKAFDYDARARLMMFRGPWDAKEWTSYHPDAKRLFTAWANGHNAYIASHADNLPVEFKLTGVKPEPWTAQTVALRWSQLNIDSTSAGPTAELQLALNVKKFGAEEANRRAAPDPYDDLKVPEGLDLNWITERRWRPQKKAKATRSSLESCRRPRSWRRTVRSCRPSRRRA